MYALPIELIYISYSMLASFPSAARFKEINATGFNKKTAFWSITSGASFWLNSLHATRAEALCILRERTVFFILIFDLCEWYRLHVHCWFLHGSRVPHTNGKSILITNWSVCTGISYWREPSSCSLHEGTLVIYTYLGPFRAAKMKRPENN